MSRRSEGKARRQAVRSGLPWIVPCLFLGLLAGVIDEVIHGLSMLRMAGGAIAGLLIGSAIDFRRSLKRKDGATARRPDNSRE